MESAAAPAAACGSEAALDAAMGSELRELGGLGEKVVPVAAQPREQVKTSVDESSGAPGASTAQLPPAPSGDADAPAEPPRAAAATAFAPAPALGSSAATPAQEEVDKGLQAAASAAPVCSPSDSQQLSLISVHPEGTCNVDFPLQGASKAVQVQLCIGVDRGLAKVRKNVALFDALQPITNQVTVYKCIAIDVDTADASKLSKRMLVEGDVVTFDGTPVMWAGFAVIGTPAQDAGKTCLDVKCGHLLWYVARKKFKFRIVDCDVASGCWLPKVRQGKPFQGDAEREAADAAYKEWSQSQGAEGKGVSFFWLSRGDGPVSPVVPSSDSAAGGAVAAVAVPAPASVVVEAPAPMAATAGVEVPTETSDAAPAPAPMAARAEAEAPAASSEAAPKQASASASAAARAQRRAATPNRRRLLSRPSRHFYKRASWADNSASSRPLRYSRIIVSSRSGRLRSPSRARPRR